MIRALVLLLLSNILEVADAVVGGSIATDGQFPSIVSLRWKGSHTCGGTIIQETWILTAAHCVFLGSTEHMSIYVGSINLTTGGTLYDVDRFIIHDDFSYITVHNDIALIHLSLPISLSNRASIATMTGTPVPNGADVITAGWGRTWFLSAFSEELRFFSMTRISRDDCSLLGAPSWSTNMCAKSSSVSELSMGDSGSPAFYENVVVGVASHAIKSNVFTDVTKYYEWVHNIIEEKL